MKTAYFGGLEIGAKFHARHLGTVKFFEKTSKTHATVQNTENKVEVQFSSYFEVLPLPGDTPKKRTSEYSNKSGQKISSSTEKFKLVSFPGYSVLSGDIEDPKVLMEIVTPLGFWVADCNSPYDFISAALNFGYKKLGFNLEKSGYDLERIAFRTEYMRLINLLAHNMTAQHRIEAHNNGCFELRNLRFAPGVFKNALEHPNEVRFYPAYELKLEAPKPMFLNGL